MIKEKLKSIQNEMMILALYRRLPSDLKLKAIAYVTGLLCGVKELHNM